MLKIEYHLSFKDEAQIAALDLTAEALHTEIVNAGVMPFYTATRRMLRPSLIRPMAQADLSD